MIFSAEGLLRRPRQNHQTNFQSDLKAYATYTFDTVMKSGLRAVFTRLLDFGKKSLFLVLVRARWTSAPEAKGLDDQANRNWSLPPSSVLPARSRG